MPQRATHNAKAFKNIVVMNNTNTNPGKRDERDTKEMKRVYICIKVLRVKVRSMLMGLIL